MNVLLLAALLAPTAEPDNPVLTAARKRQQAIKSIEAVCSVNTIVEPGALNDDPRGHERSGKLWPDTRLTFNDMLRYVFDGSRSRTEDRARQSRGGLQTIKVRNDQWVKEIVGPTEGNTIDNTKCGVWHIPQDSDTAAPTGWRERFVRYLTKPDDPLFARMSNTKGIPLLHACRPECPPGWSIKWLPLAGLRKQSPPQGEALEEYLPDESDPHFRLWVDPQKDYSVVRIRWPADMAVPASRELHIRHKTESTTDAWLPIFWEELSYFEDGSIRTRETVTVTKLSVNASWPDSEFDLTFPPGLQVFDHGDGMAYTAEADGSLTLSRQASDKSRSPNPEPPPPLIDLSRDREWLSCLGVVVGVAMLVVAWKVARRLIVRPTNKPNE